MNKLELMQQFISTFVGNNFHLLIREKEGTFKVHTIEVIQKTDDTCPVKEIPVGGYFIHLIAADQHGNDASIVCNWTETLLQNLLDTYKEVRDADFSQITMYRDPFSSDPNKWLLLWGSDRLELATSNCNNMFTGKAG
jgi:hypothetical protein